MDLIHARFNIRYVRSHLLAALAPATMARRRAHIPQDERRVDGHKYADSNHHDGSVQGDKVRLTRDEIPRPTLRKLDGPVNASNVDHGEAHQHGAQHPLHAFGDQASEPQATTADAAKEIGAQHAENGHGDELKCNTGYHDVRSLVLSFFGICSGSFGAADGLDDERDEVAGAKDDGI